jgi:hypothetical protein
LNLVAGEAFNPFSLYNYCSPDEGEHFFAGVAQLVEQLIRNQQVTGSSPVAGFNSIVLGFEDTTDDADGSASSALLNSFAARRFAF